MVVYAYKPSDGKITRLTLAVHWVLGCSLGRRRPCLKYPKLGAWEGGNADYEGFAVVLWNKSQPCLKGAMWYWHWKKITLNKVKTLISIGVESVYGTNRNHPFSMRPQPCFPIMSHFFSYCWQHSLFVTCRRATPVACSKLMHPVGKPGSIDVSARLASTLAGFLSGVSPSSWLLFGLL